MRGDQRDQGSLRTQGSFDYIVGEKLQNFAEASLHHREFARELPSFVSEVRRMFTPDEIETLSGRKRENQRPPS